jgi:hypothetical protein
MQTLLADLARAKSPLDRLRLLALGWRTVRELDSNERADLATRLGLEGAEGLVEKLARRKGGLGPSELLEAVHSARQAEPAKLRQLLSGLRSREGRKALLDGGVKTLERELLGESEPEVESLFEPLPDDQQAAAAGPDQVPGPPLIDPGPQFTPVEEDGPFQLPDQPPRLPDEPPPLEAVSEPEEAPPFEPEPAAVSGEEPVPETPPAVEPEPEPPGSAEPTAADPGDAADRVLGSLAGTRSLVGRLRRLRTSGDALVSLDLFELRRLVETFPEGWARRRAVAGLLEAGVPHSLAAALDLIMGLEQERDRVWCLSALLTSRPDVRGSLLKTALETVHSPIARRRLERLAAG